MKVLFKNDFRTVLVYLVIFAIALGLSCIGFAFNTPYSYYPLVITAISFSCGLIYLLALLFNAKKKNEITPETKNLALAAQLGSNFLRFAIMVIAVLCCFLFIYFSTKEGEVEKWVYLLILIAGVPMIVDVALFYLRSVNADK